MMHKVANVRDLALWKDVSPQEVWPCYARRLDRLVSIMLPADRPQPIVRVRPEPADPAPGARDARS